MPTNFVQVLEVILERLPVRYSAEGEARTLFDWASRSAASLVALPEERDEKVSFPELVWAPVSLLIVAHIA